MNNVQPTSPTPLLEPYVTVSIETTFDEDGDPLPALMAWIIVGPLHGQLDRLTIVTDREAPENAASTLQECRDFIATIQKQAAQTGLRFESIDLEADLEAWREEWHADDEADPA